MNLVAQNSFVAIRGALTPVGYSNAGGSIYCDFQNDRAFQTIAGPTTGSAGIKAFNVGILGSEYRQAPWATTFGGTLASPANQVTALDGASVYHPMGKLICPVSAAGGAGAIINPNTLVLDNYIGTSQGAPTTCDAITGVVQRVAGMNWLIGLQRGNTNYLISKGGTSAGKQREPTVLNVTNPAAVTLLSAVNLTQEHVWLGQGPCNSSAAVFYVMGSTDVQTDPITLYRYTIVADSVAPATVYTLPNAAVSRVTLATVNPSDIDSGWTKFITLANFGYDQADGNPLIPFGTNEPVTNKFYLVKFDGLTGAIRWKVALPNGLAGGLNLSGSNIARWLAVQASAGLMYIFDLSNGSYGTQRWNAGFNGFSNQICDCKTNSLTGQFSYTQSATGPLPVYLGPYLAAHGNATPGGAYGRIFLGAITQLVRPLPIYNIQTMDFVAPPPYENIGVSKGNTQ